MRKVLVNNTFRAVLNRPICVLETRRAGDVLSFGLIARETEFAEVADHQILEEDRADRLGVGGFDREKAVARQSELAVLRLLVPPAGFPLDNLLVIFGKSDKVNPLVERRIVFEKLVDEERDHQIPEDRFIPELIDVCEGGRLFRGRQVDTRKIRTLHPERELRNLVDCEGKSRQLQGIDRRGIRTR